MEIRPPEVGWPCDLPIKTPVGEPTGAICVPLQGAGAQVAGLAVGQELLAEIVKGDVPPGEWSSKGSDHAAPLLLIGGRRLKNSPVLRWTLGRLVRHRAKGNTENL